MSREGRVGISQLVSAKKRLIPQSDPNKNTISIPPITSSIPFSNPVCLSVLQYLMCSSNNSLPVSHGLCQTLRYAGLPLAARWDAHIAHLMVFLQNLHRGLLQAFVQLERNEISNIADLFGLFFVELCLAYFDCDGDWRAGQRFPGIAIHLVLLVLQGAELISWTGWHLWLSWWWWLCHAVTQLLESCHGHHDSPRCVSTCQFHAFCLFAQPDILLSARKQMRNCSGEFAVSLDFWSSLFCAHLPCHPTGSIQSGEWG